jgi:hypothetical protein
MAVVVSCQPKHSCVNNSAGSDNGGSWNKDKDDLNNILSFTEKRMLYCAGIISHWNHIPSIYQDLKGMLCLITVEPS